MTSYAICLPSSLSAAYISHSADLGVIVIGDFSSFGSEGHIVQFRLCANDHSPLTGKLEVGASGTQVDFPD
jgi:hypothetical protein